MKALFYIVLFAFIALPREVLCETPDSAAKSLSATIDHLIDYVSRSGLNFVRNGETGEAPAAASHIRDKYNHYKSSIKSPEDFIDKCAAKSLLTGTDYLVILPDGTKKNVKDWLTDELVKYRKLEEPAIR